jgi:hypothetical protein
VRQNPGSTEVTARKAILSTLAATQRDGLLWTAGIAFLFGLLASPIFARLLPFGLDGRVAAYILQADRWGAGAALIQAGNPQAWRGMMDGHNLARSNQDTLAACRDAAVKAKVKNSTVRSSCRRRDS